MGWRESLAAYLESKLAAAESVEVVNVRGMPAGASNDTVSFDARVHCDGAEFDVPLVLRPERPDGILALRAEDERQIEGVPLNGNAGIEADRFVAGASRHGADVHYFEGIRGPQPPVYVGREPLAPIHQESSASERSSRSSRWSHVYHGSLLLKRFQPW